MEKNIKSIEEEGVMATIVLAKLVINACKAAKARAERIKIEADITKTEARETCTTADTELVLAEKQLKQLEEKLREIQLARAVEERRAGMEAIG